MTTYVHHQSVVDDLNLQHREHRQAIPEVYRDFADLSSAALAPGVRETRTKEHIAMAIGVSFLMKAGPATMCGARAYAAFCKFAVAVEAKAARAWA